jgi:hypothetical protein
MSSRIRQRALIRHHKGHGHFSVFNPHSPHSCPENELESGSNNGELDPHAEGLPNLSDHWDLNMDSVLPMRVVAAYPELKGPH